jgi:hypothetical protein
MPPRKPMPITLLERFGGLTLVYLTTIGGGLLSLGVNYQQFQQIKQAQQEGKEEQKAMSAKLSEFREKQIGGLQDVQVLKTNVQNLDSRVLVIERIFIDRPQPPFGNRESTTTTTTTQNNGNKR